MPMPWISRDARCDVKNAINGAASDNLMGLITRDALLVNPLMREHMQRNVWPMIHVLAGNIQVLLVQIMIDVVEGQSLRGAPSRCP